MSPIIGDTRKDSSGRIQTYAVSQAGTGYWRTGAPASRTLTETQKYNQNRSVPVSAYEAPIVPAQANYSPTERQMELPAGTNTAVQAPMDMSQLALLTSPNALLSEVKKRLMAERARTVDPLETRRADIRAELMTTGERTFERLGSENLERYRVSRDMETNLLRSQLAEVDARIQNRQQSINDLAQNLSAGTSELFQSLIAQQQQDTENKMKLRQLEMDEEQQKMNKWSTIAGIQLNTPAGRKLSDLGLTGAEGERIGLKEPTTISDSGNFQLIENEDEYGNKVYRVLNKKTGEIKTADANAEKVVTDLSGMNILADVSTQPLASNCVKYVRETGVSNLPYGLYTKGDKEEAVREEGFTNPALAQIGDAVLTGEGQYGHVAKIIDDDDENFILEEANYSSNKVTTGRMIAKNDPNIYGFVKPKIGPAMMISGNEREGQVIALSDQILEMTGIGAGQTGFNKYEEIVNQIMDPVSGVTLKDYPQKTREKLIPILNQRKNEALSSGDIYGVMLASAGGESPSGEFQRTFAKASTVVNQIQQLNTAFDTGKMIDQQGNKIDISPLSGWLRKKNPWDTKAQEVKAILQATVPNLARGIYGEVGVLTDTDINNYIKTLPNLQQTDAVKLAVTGLTLRTIKNSLDAQIAISAGSDTDMSGLVGFYKILNNKINEIEISIGINADGMNINDNPLNL